MTDAPNAAPERPAPRKLTARGTERRRQLIELATSKFAAAGYHPTSVADIVDGLGVGKGVFYWYFDSKEMLFEEILREAQKDLRRTQQRAIGDLDDPLARMEQGIRAAVVWTSGHRDLATLVDFAQTDTRFAHLIRSGRAALVRDVVPLLRAAMEAGNIPDADPEPLAHAILGVSANLTSVFIQQQGRDPDEIAEVVVDFCLRGIGAR